MADLLVVGCGLIGTSVGLALRGVSDVLLHDEDASRVTQAVGRGAGRAWDGRERAVTVLAAVPPRLTGPVLSRCQKLDLARTYTHVASVQSQVQREVESLNCDLSAVVGGHPLAGRETSGPGAATGDLFVGRPWAICPSPHSSLQSRQDVRVVAEACGATPLEIDLDLHDAAVALLSHLPQVAASAVAGLLVGGGPEVVPGGAPTRLSGPGLVDTTRLAASDPGLWSEILQMNAAHVVPAVRALAGALSGLADQLDAADASAVRTFLERGNQGRALVPVKRGEVSEAFARVPVSVNDQPGRLAALLTDAGRAGVNVEDVHVEHVPGRPQGVIELLVDVASVGLLTTALEQSGWTVLGT